MADDRFHLRLLEALLFAAPEPMTEAALAARLPKGADVRGLLRRLADAYADRGVLLVQAGRTWAFSTAPDLAPSLRPPAPPGQRLSRAAVETLAIIAYQQPVTRAEIEEVRGVQVSRGTLDLLFDLGWIAPRGRRETPGRPMTWGTTDAFLRHFGLRGLADLPTLADVGGEGIAAQDPAAAGAGLAFLPRSAVPGD